MFVWHSNFQTSRPMSTLPRLMGAAQERHDSPKYRHCGRFRQAERHVLFKYTLSGTGAFLDAAGEHKIPAGFGFLCEINDTAIEYYYPPWSDETWEFVFICFEGDLATQMARELVARHGPVYALPRDGAAVARMLSLRAREEDAKRDVSPGEGASVVFELLTALAIAKEATPKPPDAGEALVRKAKEVIKRSLPEGMPVSELAESLEVSREHLTRVFRREIARSPHEYINWMRMLHACRLLKETSLEIKEIGDKIGIASQQQFSRTFRRALRMSPSQFRSHGVVPQF